MSSKELIQRLWAEHMSEPFPGSAYALEVVGADLVALDTAASGIIQSGAEGAHLMPL
jgi:hypothetical protein